MATLLNRGTVATALGPVTTAPNTGTTIELALGNGFWPTNIGWQIVFTTAAPTAQNTVLEGSLDGVTWLTLDTSTIATGTGEVRTITAKAVKYVRARLTAVTIGTCAGITVLLIVG